MPPRTASLSDLPTEILYEILSYDISHYIVALWITGNLRLSHRLSSGGAAKVVLTDRSLRVATRLPLLLVELKCLRYLSIACNPRSMSCISSIRSLLKLLPPTLEELHLDMHGSLAALMSEHAVVASANGRMARHGDYEHVTGMWSLNTVFPRLTVLILNGVVILHFLRDVDFESLPRSLITLDIQAVISLDKSSDWQRLDLLPQTLENFLVRLSPGWWTDSAIERLPRSILRLETLYVSSSDTIPLIPPNLQSVTHFFGDHRFPHPLWPPSPLLSLLLRLHRLSAQFASQSHRLATESPYDSRGHQIAASNSSPAGPAIRIRLAWRHLPRHLPAPTDGTSGLPIRHVLHGR